MVTYFFNRIVRSIISGIIYSNLWVALSAGSLTLGIAIINHLSPSLTTVVLNICLTFMSYNYIYWIGNNSNPSKMDYDRKEWMDSHWGFNLTLNVIAAGYTIHQINNLTSIQWILLITLFLLSTLYILPSKTNKGIRWLPGLKIFIISISWSILIVPFSFGNLLPFNSLMIQTLMVFLFVTALAIPFDLRDLKDDAKNLRTIPQIIGTKRGVRLSQFLFLIVGTTIILNASTLSIKTIHFIFLLATLLLIHKSIHQKPHYYNFWLEGIPIFWVSGILLVK